MDALQKREAEFAEREKKYLANEKRMRAQLRALHKAKKNEAKAEESERKANDNERSDEESEVTDPEQRAGHKRRLEERIENHQIGSGRTKRPKSCRLWEVIENKETAGWLKKVFRTHVWRTTKFMANEAELADAMYIALGFTESICERLVILEEDEREEMLRRYCVVYGTGCSKALNDVRNGLQQKIKPVYMGLLKENKAFSSKQLHHVAQRLNLTILDEAVKHKKTAAGNKAKNNQNKKYRERFDTYVDQYVTAFKGTKNWSIEKRCNTTLSGTDGNKEPALTSSDEAMIILQVENAERKWNEENTFLAGGFDAPPRTATRDLVKYSDDKGGNNKFGNWSEEGRKRYNQLRAQIKKGRGQDDTPTWENQSRLRLYDLHQMGNDPGSKKASSKDKVPRIDLTNAAVGDASDDDNYEIEAYETDDEADELLKKAQVAKKAAHVVKVPVIDDCELRE